MNNDIHPISTGSQLPQTTQGPLQKRAREQDSTIEVRPVHRRLIVLPVKGPLRSIPFSLLSYIITFLNFANRTTMNLIDRQFREEMGNRSIYLRVLSASGLTTAFSELTCAAARVHAAITSGHRLCMSFMAEQLTHEGLYGPTRSYFRHLLQKSTEGLADVPETASLQSRRQEILVSLQLAGELPMLETDDVLCQRNGFLISQPYVPPAQKIDCLFNIFRAAAWGFYPRSLIETLHVKMVEFADARESTTLEGMTSEHRKKIAMLRDLVSHLLVTNEHELNTSSKLLEGYLKSAPACEQLQGLKLLDLVHLVCEQHKREPEIQWLEATAEDSRHSPHLRVLAILTTLSRYRSAPTIPRPKLPALCRTLKTLRDHNYLRLNVYREAGLALLRAFVETNYQQIPGVSLSDQEIAILACEYMDLTSYPILGTPLSLASRPPEHGLKCNDEFWATCTVIRLRVEGRAVVVDSSQALAMVFFSINNKRITPPAKIRELETYLTSLPRSEVTSCMDYANEIAVDSLLQALEAPNLDPEIHLNNQLLLANMYNERRTGTKVSRAQILAILQEVLSKTVDGSEKHVDASLALYEAFGSHLAEISPELDATHVITYLKHVLRTSPIPQQTHRARLQLARIGGHVVSHEESIELCRQVHDDLNASEYLRRMASAIVFVIRKKLLYQPIYRKA